MTKLNQTHWSLDDDNINMSLEFTKVNKEKRLVFGFATLDNVDTQGDLVLAEASKRAFARARGNLREMHKKDSAVGKIVDFKEDEFRTSDGKRHKGIFVTARVSEGAPNTWLKVLDGTLNGFSIGGKIVSASEDWNKDANQKVRVIEEYELTELSLVDNPANQFANIFSIQKQADGSVTVKGMVAETTLLNVFFCKEDEISLEKPSETNTCPVCEQEMERIGWIEQTGDIDMKVRDLVTKFLGASHESEGGEKEMEKSENETVDTGHDEGDKTEVPTPAEPADVEEVHDEENEVIQKINELKVVVEKNLDEARNETNNQVKVLETKIDELNSLFVKKTAELDASLNEKGEKLAKLEKDLGVQKGRFGELEKALDIMNSSDAFRKSAYLEAEETEPEKHTIWNGAFSVRNLLG